MNLAQAKDKQVNLVVKSMLANNISWRSFNDFKEPLRSELKRKYKQENCIVVVVVREDEVEEDPVYAVGVLKLPGKKNDSSSDYGSDDETDADFDEETDFDIGVMVVGVNPNAEDKTDGNTNADDIADADTPGTSNGGARNAGSSAARGKANAAKGGTNGGAKGSANGGTKGGANGGTKGGANGGANGGASGGAKGGAKVYANYESSDESEDDDYDNSPNAFFLFSSYR